jgi:hypothetical protein
MRRRRSRGPAGTGRSNRERRSKRSVTTNSSRRTRCSGRAGRWRSSTGIPRRPGRAFGISALLRGGGCHSHAMRNAERSGFRAESPTRRVDCDYCSTRTASNLMSQSCVQASSGWRRSSATYGNSSPPGRSGNSKARAAACSTNWRSRSPGSKSTPPRWLDPDQNVGRRAARSCAWTGSKLCAAGSTRPVPADSRVPLTVQQTGRWRNWQRDGLLIRRFRVRVPGGPLSNQV